MNGRQFVVKKNYYMNDKRLSEKTLDHKNRTRKGVPQNKQTKKEK